MSKSNLNLVKPSATDAAAASINTKRVILSLKKFSDFQKTNQTTSWEEFSVRLANEEVIKFKHTFFKLNTFGQNTSTFIVVQFDSIGKQHSVNYRMSFLDAKGISHFIQEGTATHQTPNGIFYISLDGTEDLGLLVNDTLRVCCEIKVVDKEVNSKSSFDNGFQQSLSRWEATSKITQDIASLLENSKFADVLLVVGKGRAKKEFHAHKNILTARSTFFGAMFEHKSTREAKESRVVITDVPEDVFEQFFRFMYTGKVTEMDKYAQDLLTLADKYQMDSLTKRCSTYLSSKLTTESVSSILMLADLHNAAELKSNCVDYIADHAEQVMQTDQFKLLKDKPELLIELLQNQSVKRFKK